MRTEHIPRLRQEVNSPQNVEAISALAAHAYHLGTERREHPNSSKLEELLVGADTFPEWLDSDEDGWIFGNRVKKPVASKYAQLLADYIEFLRDEGFTVDYLGPNNETDGAVPAWRFSEVVRHLRAELEDRQVPPAYRDFLIVGPDSFGIGATSNPWPNARTFADQLIENGRIGYVDVIGGHFYPQYGSGLASDWEYLAEETGKPLWHTEVHMPIGSSDDLPQVIRDT